MEFSCFDNVVFYGFDFEKAAKAVSNTSLYKQAGNSIVVPVLEGIFRSLFMGQNKADTDEVQELHQFNLF